MLILSNKFSLKFSKIGDNWGFGTSLTAVKWFEAECDNINPFAIIHTTENLENLSRKKKEKSPPNSPLYRGHIFLMYSYQIDCRLEFLNLGTYFYFVWNVQFWEVNSLSTDPRYSGWGCWWGINLKNIINDIVVRLQNVAAIHDHDDSVLSISDTIISNYVIFSSYSRIPVAF